MQQSLTLDDAMKLAERKNRWKLLVQILIDSKHEYKKAIDMIRNKVTNLRDKVDLL